MKLYSRKIYESEKLKDKGESCCPFCKIDEEQEQYIIWKGKYWYVAHNKYPYGGMKNNLLVIPYSCKKHTSEISAEEFSEFPTVQKFMKEFYKGGNYFSFIREIGEVKSIHHLHYHFLPGEIHPEPLEKMLKKQGF